MAGDSVEESELLNALAGIGQQHPLTGARAKLSRAAEHLKSLKKEARTFRERRSYSIGSYTHPDTGNYFLYVTPKPVPPLLSTIAGDVLCNLRPALDYLIFALARLDSGESPEGTQFPICDTSAFFGRKKGAWLKGLSPEHVAAIEKLQPYKGRNGKIWLAWLRDLSNPDKHRELSIMISDVGGDFEILKKPQRVVRRKDATPPSKDSIRRLAQQLAEGPKPETKQEITVSIPEGHKLAGADVNVHVGLRFDVAFENGLPVIDALEVFHRLTTELIQGFEPEFKR